MVTMMFLIRANRKPAVLLGLLPLFVMVLTACSSAPAAPTHDIQPTVDAAEGEALAAQPTNTATPSLRSTPTQPAPDMGKLPPPHVVRCIENELGRPLDGAVTRDERISFEEVCGASGGSAQDPNNESGPGGLSFEMAACAERVLGRSSIDALTEDDRNLIRENCVGLGVPIEPPLSNSGQMPIPPNSGNLPPLSNSGQMPIPPNSGNLPPLSNRGQMPIPSNSGNLPPLSSRGQMPIPPNSGNPPPLSSSGGRLPIPPNSGNPPPLSSSGPMSEPSGGANSQFHKLTVIKNSDSYASATAANSSKFKAGQAAELQISGFGFNNSGGTGIFNHPVSVASEGTHLAVSDRFNNRVLIWNTLPSANVNPDIVLGQLSPGTQMEGQGLNGMSFPGQISIGESGVLVVADTGNNRILVWRTFPTESGQPADFEIDVDSIVGYPGSWPWGVWTNGDKLAVASTVGGKLLFWDSFPSASSDGPDYIVSHPSVGTPRGITSNGEFFMTGDENGVNDCAGAHGTKSTHIWFEWPQPQKAPDSCADNWLGGTIAEGKLITAAGGGESLYWWDSLPVNAAEALTPTLAGPGRGHRWLGGDGVDAAYAGGKLFIAEYNGNRISVFDEIPDGPNAEPDWALGAADPETNTLFDNWIIQNPVPASNGQRLFVSSDFDRSLSVWNNIPGESGAVPDLYYRTFDEAPWDISVWGDTVFLAGKHGVYGWESFDGSGALPEIELIESIGSVSLEDLMGVAYNGELFALADNRQDKVWIWEGLPSSGKDPKYSLSIPSGPGRLDMDDEWLVIAGYPADKTTVKVIRLADLSEGVILEVPRWTGFPQSAAITDIGFFVTLQGDNEVVGWQNVDQALNGSQPTMRLGTGSVSKSAKDLRMPNAIDWDGAHLWVGEFKFSNRMLGFSPVD